MAFQVEYINERGETSVVVCRGSALESALAGVGVGQHQVLSARPTVVLPDFFTRIAAKEQLLILMRLQPLLASGRAADIPGQLSEFPGAARILKRKTHLLDDGLNLSERLDGLGFDAGVVTLIRAGEQSGRVTDNLRDAVEHLSASIKLAQQTSRSVWMGATLFLVAIFALLAVSTALYQPLIALQNISHLQLKINPLSEILLALGWFMQNMGWVLAPILAGAGYAAFRYWGRLSMFWPLSCFRQMQNTSRSLRLAMIWKSLLRAGSPIEKNQELVSAAVGRPAAESIFAGLREGRTFGNLLIDSWFSPTLNIGCQRLMDSSPAEAGKSLEQLINLLASEKDLYSRRAARVFYIAGVVIAVITLVLLLGGILFPIYSSGLGVAR